MSDPARKLEPITLEEFDAMDFGDRRVELIDGEVVVAQAFPSGRHGQVAASMVVALFQAIRAAEADCRVETGTGIDIRLDTDFRLGPDVMVRCGDGEGLPVLVVEVLSPSNSASEMLRKLRAYQAVESITDILFLEQDEHYAQHWSRRPGEPWGAPAYLIGADALVRIARFGAEIPLADVYRQALRDR